MESVAQESPKLTSENFSFENLMKCFDERKIKYTHNGNVFISHQEGISFKGKKYSLKLTVRIIDKKFTGTVDGCGSRIPQARAIETVEAFFKRLESTKKSE